MQPHAMLTDAFEAFAQMFSPPLRKVMSKSLLVTAAVLLSLAFCLDRLVASMMPIGPAWLTWLLSIVVAVGLLAGVILLAPPTASLVAGFYLDDVAATVEREIDPMCAAGVPPPLVATLGMGVRFAALSLMVNVAVILLTLVAGLGFAAFFLLNGYLLGREYFDLIAMRHMPRPAPSQELGTSLFCRPHHFRLRRRPGFKSAHAAFRRRLYDTGRETTRITGRSRCLRQLKAEKAINGQNEPRHRSSHDMSSCK
jgi:CysZ protein